MPLSPVTRRLIDFAKNKTVTPEEGERGRHLREDARRRLVQPEPEEQTHAAGAAEPERFAEVLLACTDRLPS
jgi:hypothetical protein